MAAACRQGIWREKRIQTRRRGTRRAIHHVLLVAAGTTGEKLERERGRGTWKGNKTVDIKLSNEGGMNLLSYPLVSSFSGRRFTLDLFRRLCNPFNRLRSFFPSTVPPEWGQSTPPPRPETIPSTVLPLPPLHGRPVGEEGDGWKVIFKTPLVGK